MNKMKNSNSILILGDILAIVIVTIIGFATHGEAASSFLPRMAASFFPITIAWFLLAPWFGLFQQKITSNPSEFWRPALVMLFAAPLAVVMRGFILNAAILPIFAVVLGATSAFGMVVWRYIWVLIQKRLAHSS